MVKKSRQIRLACLLLMTQACASSGVAPESAINGLGSGKFERGSHRVGSVWNQRFTGYITDIAVSSDGQITVVATAPNYDSDNGSKKYLITRLVSTGDSDWTYKPSAPVKSLAVSADGALTVVSTYDDQLTALDSDGEEQWSVEATCKPIFLAQPERFLCYHDDDAEPDTAFDVYDFSGHKLVSFPIKQDVLSLKVSEDRKNIAFALTQGEVVLVGADYKAAFDAKVDGEVSDLAVSSGDHPRVAVVYQKSRRAKGHPMTGIGQKIRFFNSDGKPDGDASPSGFVEDMAFSLDGRELIVHGNSRQGQYLAAFDAAASNSLSKELWKKTVSHFAEVSARVAVARDQVIVGFEQESELARANWLMSIDLKDGQERWGVPVQTEEGAYLYADSLASGQNLIVIGSDDGRIAAFRFD